jgi:hypothetical protein
MRVQTMRVLPMMLLCASISLAAQTSSAGNKSAPVKTVQQLFEEDQNDQPGHVNGTSFDEQQHNARLELRKQQVRTFLANGDLKTGEDFYDAAFVFQHGETADDFLFAHVLAMDAVVKGYDIAKWIAAATLDRYLQIVHQPQVFGTQYPLDPDKPHPPEDITPAGRFKGRTLRPYNDMLLPDSLRTDFCVASRDQQKQVLAFMDTGKRPPGALMVAPGCKR